MLHVLTLAASTSTVAISSASSSAAVCLARYMSLATGLKLSLRVAGPMEDSYDHFGERELSTHDKQHKSTI